MRSIVFVGVLVALALADPLQGSLRPLALLAGAALALVFSALVVRHRRVRKEIERAEARRKLHTLGLARLDRAWDVLGASGLENGPFGTGGEPSLPHLADLHVFGRVSLFRLAGPVTTEPGRLTLARWLSSAAPVEEIRLRQDGVRALAPELGLRHRLALPGMVGRAPEAGSLAALRGWLDRTGPLAGKRVIRAAALLLPLATLPLLVLHLAAGLPPLWAVPLLVQVLLVHRTGPALASDFERVERGSDGLDAYADQLALLGTVPATGSLARIREILPDDRTAPSALRSLRRRADFARSRRNVFQLVLNYLVLVDLHVAAALDRWKVAHGDAVEAWLDGLGHVEALSALATIAHDHPRWCLPRVDETGPEPRVSADGLGHPLLPPEACVRNDVEIGPPGSFLLVTGSNMSGKSTLLRGVGANVVLALAGAPVCARSMRLPVVDLHTSMMVGDSLEEGVSRFMAELLRLREIVEAARGRAADEPPVLYLLDEMLQGTNSAERRVAARTVLRHLLGERAIGAVTTHDLTLHRASDLEARALTFHFRESVTREGGRPRLHFDYRLRPGLSTTTNALELLEAVGLAEVGESAEEGSGGGTAEWEGAGAERESASDGP